MKNIVVYLSISFIALFLFNGCSGGGSGGDGSQIDSTQTIDAYIKELPEIDQPEEAAYEIIDEEEGFVDGDYVCNSITYAGNPEFNKFMFSRSNLDVLYPGALLKGQSIVDKTYVPCKIGPGPLTLTVNLQSIDGPISKTIEKPSYSTVQTAIHEILDQNITGDEGAEMSWSVHNVYSEAHLQASLELDVSIDKVFSIGGSGGLNFAGSYKRAIIQFNQKYFDIIIDVPLSPDVFIDPDVSYDEIIDTFKDISPVYVTSVSYGRMVLFYFESSDLSMDLEAELNAAITVPIQGVPVEGKGSGKIKAGFSTGSLNCKAFILGGSGEEASKAINDLDALLEFIKTGGRYSKKSPGKPISYTLRYLSNNNPVKVVNLTEYEETECSKAYNDYRINVESFSLKEKAGVAFDQIDLAGSLKVSVSDKGMIEGTDTLWSKTSEESYPIKINETKSIDGNVDVSFDSLTPRDRQYQYIQFDIGINAEWGIHIPWLGVEPGREPFLPKTKKIYLHNLVESSPGDLPENLPQVAIDTTWHILTIAYSVEGLE